VPENEITSDIFVTGVRGCAMIKLAICDDERKTSADLERALSDILTKLRVKHEIDVYFSGEALCKELKVGGHYDLLFLDIEFAAGEANGVEVGRLIRNIYHNQRLSIVYISWHMKYSMELFDNRPLHFLIKPLDNHKVEQVVLTYLKIAGLWNEAFTYKISHDIFTAQVKDIVYLESAKRKIILHLSNGRKTEFYGALKETYREQLQRYDFLFVHSAYVVNYDYIAALEYDKIELTNGISLPVSNRRRKEIGETYYAIMEKRTV
jgi:DNA-binding LytR/AlgR family response regulator